MQRNLFLLACIIVCENCFSQQYPFVHYTPKDGLVNSRVKKVYQDSKGRMYFLTYGGLSVFDGVRFRNYTTQNGLAVDIVNDILEVGDDSFLVATNSSKYINVLVNGKLGILNTGTGPSPTVNQFYRHDDEKIYLSSDNGLFVLEHKKIRALNISPLIQSKSGEPAMPYLANITGDGKYLVITVNEMRFSKGIFLYDIRNDRICDAMPNTIADLLGKDEDKNIWMTISDTIYVLDTTALVNGKLLLVRPGNTYMREKYFSTINSVGFNKKRICLVYTKRDGNKEIRLIEPNGSLTRIPLPEIITVTGISHFFIDRENIIWLSSDGQGAYKMVNSSMLVFENPLGKLLKGYIDHAFYSDNRTWFSTNTSKMFCKSRKGLEEFTTNTKQTPNVFFANKENLLAADKKNIYRAEINNQTKSILFNKIISLDEGDFFGSSMIIDVNGMIITQQRGKLVVRKENRKVFELPLVMKENIEGLYMDKNNLLWVVKRHYGAEIFSLHPENVSKYLQRVFEITPSKLTGSTRCFLIDKKGLIWIGTRENGLFAYKLESNNLKQLFHFHTGNGLTDNFVTTIACDSLNNIIAGTQTGLDRIIQQGNNQYRIENVSKSSNLFSFINLSWADEDNNSFALTNSGVLLQLSAPLPETLNSNPQLLIEEIRVNTQSISQEKKKFRHKENNISFQLAAPSFIDESQVSFSYLLEGSVNHHWSDTTPLNAVINFSNLSTGTYLLKVRAFFPSTSYKPAELSYSFEITPAWWQNGWFKTGIGILGIWILVSVVRFYYRRKMEKQLFALERKQAIEKERTRISTDMHDDLGAGLSRIKFLSETIGIKKQKSQPIEEDISKIREYSHDMIDKMGEIVWALNEKNDSLSDLLSYSRSYAMEYLSQCGLNCEIIIPENVPVVFVSGEFRRNIFLVLKEALHNIVKHAQASEVKMRIDIDKQLVIVLKDDGVGIDTNTLRPFSNGLHNMEKRMKDIGGSFQVKNIRDESSRQDKGTVVILVAPLGR